jgi:hypothetical protein
VSSRYIRILVVVHPLRLAPFAPKPYSFVEQRIVLEYAGDLLPPGNRFLGGLGESGLEFRDLGLQPG